MAVYSQQAYKDTAELITFYNLPGGPQKYDVFLKSPRFYYRNRTRLRTMLYIIEQFKHSYHHEVKEAFTDREHFTEDVGHIFKNFYEKRYLDEFKARLGPRQDHSPLAPEDDKFVEEVSKPEVKVEDHEKAVNERIERIVKEQEEEKHGGGGPEAHPEPPQHPQPEPHPTLRPRIKLQTPETVKDISSKSKIGLRFLITRAPRFISGFFRSGLTLEELPQPEYYIPPRGPVSTPPRVSTPVSGIRRFLGLGGRGVGGTLVRGAVGTGARAAVGFFATPPGWITLGIIAFFVLIILVMNLHLLDNTNLLPPYQQQVSQDAELNQTGGFSNSGSIADCSFSGASGSLKIGNPDLASEIDDIASKVGVPASVLAGIVRIESPSAFTSTDQSFISNDYDATVSSAGAIGITQFLPQTFRGIFYTYHDNISTNFGKTNFDNTVRPQTYPTPSDDVMRITSIHDELIMTAYKIRADKVGAVGPDAAWDETAVKAVAQAYQGACSYGGGLGSYCDDLASSFTNCKPSSLANTGGVDQLVNQIRSFCGPAVTASNLTCVDSNSPPIDPKAKEEIDQSTLQPAYGNVLQCIGFVQAIVAQLTGQPLTTLGDAINYAYRPVSGYSFINKDNAPNGPQPGDIAVWNMQPHGHIAYITQVIDNHEFVVAEANYCSYECGIVDNTRHVFTNTNSLVGWLRKQ